MVRVNGTDDIVDLIPAPGTIYEEGTFRNKANDLSDAVAALFGLGPDAVQNDVFSFLGKYNQHWWRRRSNLENGGYVAKKVAYTSTATFFITEQFQTTITASEFYTVDFETGEVTLTNPITIVSSADGYLTGDQINSLKGKYCKGLSSEPDKIMFLEANASTETRSNNSGKYSVRVNSGYGTELTSEFVSDKTIGDWEYMWNADRTAYPDSGIEDGYEYQYIGIPFENSAQVPVKIAMGSYTGAGAGGSAYKNTLTFDFEPKAVVFSCKEYATICNMVNPSISSYVYTNSSVGLLTVAWSGNTVSWYHASDAMTQMNYSGKTYYYIAIG